MIETCPECGSPDLGPPAVVPMNRGLWWARPCLSPRCRSSRPLRPLDDNLYVPCRQCNLISEGGNWRFPDGTALCDEHYLGVHLEDHQP